MIGSIGWFVLGTAVGALFILQLTPNPESARARVAAGVRLEVTDAVGPIGGTVYDALNLGSKANELLDLFGVPYDA